MEPSTIPEIKIFDDLIYLKAGLDSERDEESGCEVDNWRDEVNSLCDEEYAGHAEDHEDGMNSLVHSSDAPDLRV